MKHLILLALTTIFCNVALSQNVGIGETNPPVKLTVKSTGLLPSLLVKNSNEDSMIFTRYRNISLGGHHDLSTGVVAISNKHFLPLDPAQLELIAAGERSGFNVNGSMTFLKFSNVNTNKSFSIDTYVGGQADIRSWSLNYFDADEAMYRRLIQISPSGKTGFGTYEPEGQFQVNHRATVNNPTLVLLDSSTNSMPVIAMKNRGGSDYWQLRGIISQGNPSATYLDFASQAGIRMTLSGEGRLGLGNSNPSERLDVTGNMRVTGEVNRTATGTANLVPIAYGTVLADGTITSGSGNFTLTHPLAGFYDITITGENYVYFNYATVITPVSSVSPVIAGTSSGSGRLHVYLHTPAGVQTDAIFSFIVYKQ